MECGVRSLKKVVCVALGVICLIALILGFGTIYGRPKMDLKVTVSEAKSGNGLSVVVAFTNTETWCVYSTDASSGISAVWRVGNGKKETDARYAPRGDETMIIEPGEGSERVFTVPTNAVGGIISVEAWKVSRLGLYLRSDTVLGLDLHNLSELAFKPTFTTNISEIVIKSCP